MENYVTPTQSSDAFNCPYCQAFSRQTWPSVYWNPSGEGIVSLDNIAVSVCDRCSRQSVWYGDNLVYPRENTAPQASNDMPAEVRVDYEEARSVFAASPRSSAALLRLAVQKLCIHMGLAGKNLNEDIGELVKQGLPDRVQKALDVVRAVGNNQVHPGELDVRDNPETATTLFSLVNLIVESLITVPKKVTAVFDTLPDTAKQQIALRDGKTTGTT